MKRTLSQNKRLFQLLNKLNIDEDTRYDMVCNATGGRTTSSAELTVNECSALIKALENVLYKDETPEQRNRRLKQKARRTIFKLMYDCGFIENTMNSNEKTAKINRYIFNRTRFKKDLNRLELEELGVVIKQIQAMRRNYNESFARQVRYN